MSGLLRSAGVVIGVLALSMGLSAAAVAQGNGWNGPNIGVAAGAAGNEAQVTANQQTSSGGSQAQAQPQSGHAAAPDAGSSGTNPWAGTLPLSSSATSAIPVREFQSLVVG